MNTNKQIFGVKIAIKPLAFAVACALSTQVFAAQEQNSEQKNKTEFGVERISVTAQKRLSSLQETPIAITAFNENVIEKLGIEDITDLNSLAPNTLIITPIGSAYNVGVNIRGLGTASPSLAIDPKVGIYVDGVYLARNSGAILSIIDLERVEVLRGPQGTLWGKNTTGGAISMVTKNPSDDFEFSQKFTAGSYGLYNSITSVDSGEYNGFSAKVTFMTGEEDGWAKNTFAGNKEKNLGAKETDALRIALRYLGEDFSVNYSYDMTDGSSVSLPVQASNVRSSFTNPAIPTLHMGTNTFYGGNVFAMMAANEYEGRRESFELDSHGREEVEISGHGLTINWDFADNHSFKSITSYRDYSSKLSGLDLDGGAYFGAELDAGFQPTGNFLAIPAFTSYGSKEQDQSSQEFQFLGEFMDGKLKYVTGYYYFTEEGQESDTWNISIFTGQGANLFFAEPLQWGSYYETESDAEAVFAQLDYQLTDAFNVIVGLRYTKDEKSLTQLSAPDPMLRNDLSATEDWSKTVGSIIANYTVDSDLTLYGSITQGYAAGVFNPGTVDRFAYLNPANGGEANYAGSLIPGNPEDTTAYELGAKMILMDNRLMLNSAIFYNDNTNLLITVFDGTIQRALNSGESETLGFELDAQFAATPDLLFTASYGYRDTEFTIEDFTDVNRFSASLSMDWTVAEFNTGNLNFHANFVMNDENMFNANDASLVGEAYNILNARITLSDIKIGERSRLKVSAYGRNILDKEYVIHAANFGFFDGSTYGTPATYGIDISFNY